MSRHLGLLVALLSCGALRTRAADAPSWLPWSKKKHVLPDNEEKKKPPAKWGGWSPRQPAAAAAAHDDESGRDESFAALRESVCALRASDSLKLASRLYARWWRELLRESPEHVAVETVLIVFVLFLLVKGRKRSTSFQLTEREISELCDEWEPAPLVAAASESPHAAVVTKYLGDLHVMVDGKRLINCGTLDFLGMAKNAHVKQAAKEALVKYGCGSCGPRGFYGSIDVHVELEDKIAEYFGAQGAIAFSDASSCCTSTIAAFAKRGDLLVVDAGVSEPLRTGCVLSRAQIATYRHCDARDLERVLKSIASDDAAKRRRPGSQRRFVVCEAVFRDSGAASPLRDIVALKETFGYRLILDESLTFGVCGPHGKGARAYFELAKDDVEITTVDLGPALGAVGGVCLGSRDIVDHQRLSGAGYCFSAAAPPFVSAAALRALDLLNDSKAALAALQRNITRLHARLDVLGPAYKLSHIPSPVCFIRFDDHDKCAKAKEAIAKAGFAVADATSRAYAATPPPFTVAKDNPPALLMIAVSVHHTFKHLDTLADLVLKLHAKLHAQDSFLAAPNKPNSPAPTNAPTANNSSNSR